MDTNRQPDDSRDLQAPERLIEALSGLNKKRVFVPPQVDEAVLAAAREHLRPATGGTRLCHPFVPWAAAASVVLAATLTFTLTRNLITSVRPNQFAREDINRDGQVDILDALQLAYQINESRSANPAWDLTGDGVVDGRDAAAIAEQSVKLKEGDAS